MKHPLDKINDEAQEICSEVKSDLTKAGKHLEQIGDEYHRVTELSGAPMVLINDIDRQFEKATKLHGSDIALLFVATGLQCVRQYFLTAIPAERPGDKAAANAVKNGDKEHSDRHHRLYNPSLNEIKTNPVPFDVNIGSQGLLAGYSSLGHRGATVGHDPLIGLVVGTANIATSTVTLWGKEVPILMDSYHVYTGQKLAKGGNWVDVDVFAVGKSGSPLHASTARILSSTFADKLFRQGIEGKQIVGYSVAKEYIHLKSDVRSKDSLPLLGLSAISPQTAGELASRGFDMATVFDMGRQFAYAVAIDTLIAIIHGLFFDPVEGISRNMYEIRTRRILTYSNLIASASNAIAAVTVQFLGADGSKIADWGGYINTLHHIYSDHKFIYEIKKDFLKNQLYDRIVGSDYDFMKGDF